MNIMAQKTNKSITKRLKITRGGKIMNRKSGQNHFNAKESRKKQLSQKRWRVFDIRKKTLAGYLS